MAGNPYTESGEQFQVPDMLANRADIYNLGDIIGNHGENFKLSYIENARETFGEVDTLQKKPQREVGD